ncbi:ABC transporter permease [Nocardiopsis sp. EMB25]|uniref:ABC transporter permease n=1 Tax=Nocardiopsis sp. EMB25 TaxID=2835867 RepID=UPI0022845CCE|nr:ABC transporter permease [Nocardiopsis sp. EMB25]MCY9784127.1 ABC transporter permease [Nocardiopsis sp. EMB25]
MRRAWIRYSTAARYALLEHLRNRLALVLVVFFIPTWITLVYLVIDGADVPFLLRATGETVVVHGNHVSKISGAVNAVTLIVGFMMFIVTFRSAEFDARLAMAGYPRTYLLAAKLTALLVAAALVCAYAVAVIRLYWAPEQPVMLWLSLLGAALAFGGIGVMLASLLRGELEGMFCIIMLSIIDMGLQNPVSNPASDSDIVTLLPTYGTMQTGVAAGFQDSVPVSHLFLGPLWFVCAVLVAATAFRLRTRDRRRSPLRRSPFSRAPGAGVRGVV